MTPQSAIALTPLPSQIVTVQLENTAVRLQIYQKRTGMFMDIFMNDRVVLSGVICRDRVWLVRDAYRGFPGDLSFIDTQGASDPDYTGLGTRFILVWGM